LTTTKRYVIIPIEKLRGSLKGGKQTPRSTKGNRHNVPSAIKKVANFFKKPLDFLKNLCYNNYIK